MNINSLIIQEYCSIFLHSVINSDHLICPLEQVAFYDSSAPLSPKKLYIINDVTSEIYTLENMSLLFNGKPSEKILGSANDILYTNEPQNIFQLFNAVNDVFLSFHHLEKDLEIALKDSHPIQKITDIILPFLKNPIAVLTTSFYTLAIAEKKKQPELMLHSKDDLGKFSSEEDIFDLCITEEYRQSLQTTGPHLFPNILTTFNMLYQNIRIHGENIARIIVSEYDCKIQPGDYTVLNLIVPYYEEVFCSADHTKVPVHAAAIDTYIRSLLSEDTRKSSDEYQKFFSQHGWSIQDYYFCAKVIPSSDLGFGNSLNICIQLEKLLQGSYAIQFENYILYIVNLSYCKRTMEEALEMIIPQFRDYLIKAGISQEFNDLLMLKDFLFQADTALTIGMQKDTFKWEFRFENYAVDYLALKIKEDIPLQSFCHNSLIKLREYDKKKGRNYYEVLKTYLANNMNAAKTIRQLYMQRQTFLYQLNKIYQITGLQLTNEKTRLYLQISFSLMDNEEERS